MKKLIAMCVIITLLVSQAVFAVDNSTTASGVDVKVTQLTDSAKLVIESLKSGDTHDIYTVFNDAVKAQLTEDKLNGIWKTLVSQCGNFVQEQGTRYVKSGDYDVIYITLNFEKTNLDAIISFDKDQKVAGLFFAPSKPQSDQAKVSVDKAPAGVTETEVTIGKGEWALPGTLSMPKGSGPFSVVVLVHGSGPNDRDETVGPNKPFRDIAWGLASKGIAVLRYDKRTKVYGTKMATMQNITVKEESVDDAVAAAAMLQKVKGIDKNKIYILGHSLGGMLIPRIAMGAKGAAGFIVMAGPNRPLEDIILEQVKYLLSIDKTTEQSKKDDALKSYKTQVNHVKTLTKNSKLTPNELLGVPVTYWLDLKGYVPAKLAKNIKQPMLILQGERDYQVSLKDFNGWKSDLVTKKNVTFKTYKDLNHLFMTGTGKSVPAEYNAQNHVSENVIKDIYSWVMGKK